MDRFGVAVWSFVCVEVFSDCGDVFVDVFSSWLVSWTYLCYVFFVLCFVFCGLCCALGEVREVVAVGRLDGGYRVFAWVDLWLFDDCFEAFWVRYFFNFVWFWFVIFMIFGVCLWIGG